MAEIKKTLCKLGKSKIEAMLAELVPEVEHPQFICRKCARAAGRKKLLCKAVAMDELRRE